jgi:alkylresorcinol/alkylpyrone synthase
MSTIRRTAIAVPEYEYDQETVERRILQWLGPRRAARYERVLPAFRSGLVAKRRSAIPIERVFEERTFREKNDDYIRAAVALGERAVLDCLAGAGLAPADVDLFISASCTGFMIPSVDAVVAQRLKMRPSLARLPITQHGCAGGAVALRQAFVHLRAHPDHRVLVLAVEVPSVTFQTNDFSAENILSSTLFGDGAAAALLTADGEDHEPRIVDTASCMFPDSLDLMGFALRDTGLKIVLSKDVPDAIRAHAPAAIRGFLAGSGLSLGDIDHFLLHPGGRKIIEGFEEAFALDAERLEASRDVLRAHGNLSSATVLFMLHRHLVREPVGTRGDLGLLVAFGPGFGCESALLCWGPDALLPRARRVRTGALA